MILPMLMAGSAIPMPPLNCPPDDAVAWLCFVLGMGVTALIFLLLGHIFRR